MNWINYRAQATSLQARVQKHVLLSLLSMSRDAAPNETGGILIGRYSQDLRTVTLTKALEPPSDSVAGPITFQRGVNGLQEILAETWIRDGHYYVGEWHSHPHANASPSPTDDKQMQRIAKSTNYQCPEPVLVILGNSMKDISDCRIYLYRSRCRSLELQQTLFEERPE